MPKPIKGRRIEDVPATSFTPLTHSELRNLRLFIIGEGDIRISRKLLGRLLLDRERLGFVADSAIFWQEQRRRAAFLESQAAETDGLEADTYREEAEREIARADHLLNHAIGQLNGAGETAIVTPAATAQMRFEEHGRDNRT